MDGDIFPDGRIIKGLSKNMVLPLRFDISGWQGANTKNIELLEILLKKIPVASNGEQSPLVEFKSTGYYLKPSEQ